MNVSHNFNVMNDILKRMFTCNNSFGYIFPVLNLSWHLISIIIVGTLLLFFLVNNYDRGAQAFDKGLWPSAVFFLEKVKPTDEHYKEAQEKLLIAKEKIKQTQEKH